MLFSKKIDEVNNPIIYIFITLALSCICYGLFYDFKELAIFIVGFFFIYLIFYCGINFTILMSLFFIIGFIININYYNIKADISSPVRIIKINSYEITGSYKGKLITLETNKRLEVGKRYYVNCKLEKVQNKTKGIVGKAVTNNIFKVKDDIITKLYNIKSKVFFMIKENLGQRKAGLISSIAFGYSEYLDDEDKDDMNKFGIIHAISVSGLHVSIVYCFLKKLLREKLGLLFTIIYVIFTGCNYSSIRAFVMLASLEGSHILKRNNNSLSALCFSAMILVLIKPYSIFEVSLHLTYLATLGIILFNKKINLYLYKLPNGLRKSLSVTLSAQVFTFPYLILVFKDFSANFIIGNLVLVPFIDIIVVIGNILPLVYLCPILFDFFSYINLFVIRTFDWFVDKLQDYSLSMFYGNEYVAIFYISILISFYFVKRKFNKFIYLPAVIILLISIQIYSPFPTIKYYQEGALLITYKGDRIIATNKNNIDIKRLKKATMSNMLSRDNSVISIKDSARIKQKGKDYILEMQNKSYLLKTSNGKNSYLDCDIINLKDGNINKIIIFNDRLCFK